MNLLQVGTCSITANQEGDASWDAAPSVERSFEVISGAQTSNCADRFSSLKRVKRSGITPLLSADCSTNAAQVVGVSGSASRKRGDVRLFDFFCNTGGRLKAPRATGRWDGSVYCRQGRLVIKTYGYKFRLKLTWSAPAVGTYQAYLRQHYYLT